MRLGHVGIDVKAQAGLVLDMEIAVLPIGPFARDQARPPIHPIGELVNAKIAHRGGGMGACGRAHGTGRIVTGRPNAIEICKVGNAILGSTTLAIQCHHSIAQDIARTPSRLTKYVRAAKQNPADI